jgi:hypothetical protein
MIVYNVLINDRHTDPIIRNFTDKTSAYTFATQTAKRYSEDSDVYEETQYNPEEDDGWLLIIYYSTEGDYVRLSQEEILCIED